MLFNTPSFVISSIVLLLLWNIVPNKAKKPFLFVINYFYAYFIGGMLSLFVLFFVTSFSYFCGILIYKTKKKNIVLLILISILVLLLLFVKYIPWAINIMSLLLFVQLPNIPIISIVGISYYTFSAIAYLVDINRGNDEVDRNYVDLAIWIGFFAKFVAGPIERHVDFAPSLKKIEEYTFDFDRLKRGLLISAYGYFYKIILADRISVFVDYVYSNLDQEYGYTVFLAMIMYSFQIYFDFCGYSLIAYGISHAMNIRIKQNFDHPYFSESITEFWKRWHISLSKWLRDYIYIPLGGNRRGRKRQAINILITFILSGMWHGPGLGYIVWGFLHGMYQIIEKTIRTKIQIPKYLCIIMSFLAVSFAWVFFRADSLEIAIQFISHMLYKTPLKLSFFSQGLDLKEWCVIGLGILIAFIIEVLQTKGKSFYLIIQRQNIMVRWLLYYTIIVCLIVFGKYGSNYDSSNFIYFKY